MVFNSLVFVAFLTLVLLMYYRLEHQGQNWMLLLASYVFYGWWDYRFLALLLFTTFFDYFCALWIEGEPNQKRRRLLLASSMTVNLTVLSIFKYFNFFASSLQSALGTFGIALSLPTLRVVLPVGISFYTFLSMSYTIDVYRRELRATHNPIDFMLYVSFFPHLVAGPIVRASFLLPQCQRPRRIIPEEVANGLWLILMGYVKKVVIADRLAQVVNWGFSRGAAPFNDANSWLVIYAFAFQIYGDFSGYSDIARGLSKLMGFELVVNFRAPYLVTNASSFWRHWHISLSTWLRDYLYIPLGGNRNGRFNTYRNLTLTMLLGGLWHGAGAAYVLWGLYHGALLAMQRAWHDLVSQGTPPLPATPEAVPLPAKMSLPAVAPSPQLAAGSNRLAVASDPALTFLKAGENPPDRCPEIRRTSLGTQLKQVFLVVLFFHLTCLGWLLFRAGSLPKGTDQLHFVRHYLQTLTVLPPGIDPMVRGIVLLGAVSLFFQWKSEAMNRFSNWPTHWQAIGVLAALAALPALGVFEGAQFIYFQF